MQAMTHGILGLPDKATHRVRSPGKAAALAPNSGGRGPWNALSARFSVCSAVMFARLAGSCPTAGTVQSGLSHAICLHSAPPEALSTAFTWRVVTVATSGSCAARKSCKCKRLDPQGSLQAMRLIDEQELLSRAGSEQRPGAHSSTTRSSELQVTKLHSTGRHGEPQSHPRAPRPATKSSQLLTLFFRSSSGPAARVVW